MTETLYAALRVTLENSLKAFDVKDIASLSSSSKEMAAVVDGSSAWKLIFEEAAVLPYSSPTGITWSGEESLLTCFARPDPKILERIGYKQAVKLLFSSRCQRCDSIAGNGNPFTLERTCKRCAESNEASSSWVVVKSKAKDCFLLSDKDLNALPKAVLPVGLGPTHLPSAFFSFDDVKSASFTKWGGVNGLEREIQARTDKAVAKYNRSQGTGKPQKKRPKIERLSARPTDNPQALISNYAAQLPIGVVLTSGKGFELEHCLCCRFCEHEVTGSMADILDHHLVEHGRFYTRFSPPPDGRLIADHIKTTPTGLVPLDSLQLPGELSEILAGAEEQHSHLDEQKIIGPFFSRFTLESQYETFSLQFQHDLRIMVEIETFSPEEESDVSDFRVFWHHATTGGFKKLMHSGVNNRVFDDEEACYTMFCNGTALEQTIEDLGLVETSPVQFVAGLLSRIFSSASIRHMDLENEGSTNGIIADFGFKKFPLFRDAIAYLQQKISAARNEAK